jgi:hypothetical protein
MSKFRMFLIVMTVFAVAAPLMAQDEEMPPPMVAKNHFVTANPGQALEFEAAYKGHLEFHANNNDSWYWHTWQIANGQDFGQYIIRTGNHSWSDFEQHGRRGPIHLQLARGLRHTDNGRGQRLPGQPRVRPSLL